MEVIAVVRTFGERTQAECIRRVREQVQEVRVIQVAPFHEAVRECFRIGIGSGAEWMLTVDADVLLHDGAVAQLLCEARTCSVRQIVGRVQDKLYGGVKLAGVRLYRVSGLAEMLPHVADVIRPEGDLAKRFGYVRSDVVVGLHDYHQWRRDYYRKGRQHRVKHPHWTVRAAKWRKSKDLDLVATAQGWDGVEFTVPEVGPLEA